MVKKIKLITLLRIFLYSSLALALTFLFLEFFLIVTPALFIGDLLIQRVIYLFLAVLFSMLTVYFFIIAVNHKRFTENLNVENSYTLGKRTSFYNLEAFKNRVAKLRSKKINEKKLQFLIAFTPASLELSSNQFRNQEIIKLNLLIADYTVLLFEKFKNDFNVNESAYAFNRGIFFIFILSDDVEKIHRLIADISNQIYKIVNGEKLKVWVQPFFGIKQIERKETITAATEDVLIARSISEANYESFTFFDSSLRQESTTGLNDIQKALSNNEFVPFYQPKYSLKEKKFISAEVLARWDSPTLGLLTPGKFIERAEQAGLLNAIDVYIFKRAVKDLSDAIKRGRRVLPISVNFSLYEFFSRNFLDLIVDTLQLYQVPPTLIEIEITEGTSQTNKFLSLSVINKLKDIGVRVLMDDFGVGYAQIDSLLQIPFDGIKIDKSLIDHIIDDEKTRSVVKFITDLGHANDIEVIAEGVENKEQVEMLKKLKVDTIQGYYYSKTISLKEYQELLRHNDLEKEEK